MHAPGFLVAIAMEGKSMIGMGGNRRGDKPSRCPGMAPTPADERVAHQGKLLRCRAITVILGTAHTPQNPVNVIDRLGVHQLFPDLSSTYPPEFRQL